MPIRQIMYLWRLQHEAPRRTRQLHKAMSRAPPCNEHLNTAPWLRHVKGKITKHMGPGALAACAVLSKKAWKAAVEAGRWRMDSAHNAHWKKRESWPNSHPHRPLPRTHT